MRTALIVKSGILISLFFLIRLAFSCCNCPEQPASFQFDALIISNLDNATWTAQHTDTRQMEAAAVAFEIALSDTAFRPPPELAQNWRPSLPAARAMEPCWCPFHFYLKQEINRFTILTLLDFSPDRPAGSEIAGSFVWQVGWNHLYHSIDSLLPNLNEPFYGDLGPSKTYQLFCMDSVQNDSLQLVFQFHYANGEILSDTSDLITIRSSAAEGRL